MKPGFKTTEWWLSLSAVIVGLLLSGGFFGDESFIARVLGVIAAALTALGYTVVRGSLKGKEIAAKALSASNPADKQGN